MNRGQCPLPTARSRDRATCREARGKVATRQNRPGELHRGELASGAPVRDRAGARGALPQPAESRHGGRQTSATAAQVRRPAPPRAGAIGESAHDWRARRGAGEPDPPMLGVPHRWPTWSFRIPQAQRIAWPSRQDTRRECRPGTRCFCYGNKVPFRQHTFIILVTPRTGQVPPLR